MEEPKDIEEWMSTRDLKEVRDEFKTKEEDQPTSRWSKRNSNIPTKRGRKAGLGKQPKQTKHPLKRATPIPFFATKFDPEFIDVTLEEYNDLCKWPMNKWTHFNKMNYFAEKLREKDPGFIWPIEEPKDIEEWMSTRDLNKVREEFKTKEDFNEYDVAMKARKESVRIEKGRVTAFLLNQWGDWIPRWIKKWMNCMAEPTSVISEKTRMERMKNWSWQINNKRILKGYGSRASTKSKRSKWWTRRR